MQYSKQKRLSSGGTDVVLIVGDAMQQSIEIVKKRIIDILQGNRPSIYLFGSVAVGDFKSGWSDVDILCLNEIPMTRKQAEQLVNLRHVLLAEAPHNQYFRFFEGAFLTLSSLLNKANDTVVYWGTSGQRITDTYVLDALSTMQLLDSGIILYGDDIREFIKYPTSEDIRQAIIHHYNAIRRHAVHTGRSLYSVGWLLDIARCLYTLHTGKIITKTAAGQWAIDGALAPDIDVLQKAVQIRMRPDQYKDDVQVMDWAESLGAKVQEFADVLEKHIFK